MSQSADPKCPVNESEGKVEKKTQKIQKERKEKVCWKNYNCGRKGHGSFEFKMCAKESEKLRKAEKALD